jgi:hypothetical protein
MLSVPPRPYKSESGKIVTRDTRFAWQEFVSVVDWDIRAEFEGKRRPGGRSWNSRWKASIDNLQNGGMENSEKYVNYIIVQRRSKGLPELK